MKKLRTVSGFRHGPHNSEAVALSEMKYLYQKQVSTYLHSAAPACFVPYATASCMHPDPI
jgi:hypothetical protein